MPHGARSSTRGYLFCLPPGTRVEDWLLVGCHGHGASGVVYRAVRVGQEADGSVALKLALFPGIRASCGRWGCCRSCTTRASRACSATASGSTRRARSFPSSSWSGWRARRCMSGRASMPPTHRQGLQVLAQLARALEATHAGRAVHRDVKGDNVLVRRSDGRAMLTDFGAGHYRPPRADVAAPAAGDAALPFSRGVAVRAPLRARQEPATWPGLRMTCTRWASRPTGSSPGSIPSVRRCGRTRRAPGTWGGPLALSAGTQPPGGSPAQRADPPHALGVSRGSGTAGELAQVLEAAAEQGRAVSTPLQPRKQWGRARVLVGALLVLWTLLAIHAPLPSASAKKQVASNPASPREGGAAGVGESASKVTEPWGRESSEPEALSQDTPPKPFPGQLTPDAKGRCPGRTQIPINGGCWMELSTKDAEACEEGGYVFFRARCYAPAWNSRRKPPPTSAPPDFR